MVCFSCITDLSVEFHVQMIPVLEVVKVAHNVCSVREKFLGVHGKPEIVIGDEGVPVMSQIEFLVAFTSVSFVDADQLVVARVLGIEAP